MSGAPWWVWMLLATGVTASVIGCSLLWVLTMEHADKARADELLEPIDLWPTLQPMPGPHPFDPANCAWCAGIDQRAREAQSRFDAATERIRRLMREEATALCTWTEQDDAAVQQLLGGTS